MSLTFSGSSVIIACRPSISGVMLYFCRSAEAEIRRCVFGRLHVEAAVCAAEVIQRSWILARCSVEGDVYIPEGISKYFQEMERWKSTSSMDPNSGMSRP